MQCTATMQRQGPFDVSSNSVELARNALRGAIAVQGPSGPINLGGSTLNLTLGLAPQVGDTFTLLSSAAGPISGTFAGLAEGATFTQGGKHYAPKPSIGVELLALSPGDEEADNETDFIFASCSAQEAGLSSLPAAVLGAPRWGRHVAWLAKNREGVA
jgi:hypothetical protein